MHLALQAVAAEGHLGPQARSRLLGLADALVSELWPWALCTVTNPGFRGLNRSWVSGCTRATYTQVKNLNSISWVALGFAFLKCSLVRWFVSEDKALGDGR